MAFDPVKGSVLSVGSYTDADWDLGLEAAFIDPTYGTLNANPAQLFTWTTSFQDQAYDLVVGTTPGSANLLNTGVLPPSQGSYRAPPLPADPRWRLVAGRRHSYPVRRLSLDNRTYVWVQWVQ